MFFSALAPRSIRGRITLWCGLCLWVACGVIIAHTASMLRSKAIDSTTAQVKVQLGDLAKRVELRIEGVRRTAMSVAQILSATKNRKIMLDIGRPEIRSILHMILAENPDYLGIFTCWDAGALDGLDEAYQGESGNDSSGRFMPYWTRDADGEIRLGILTDHDVEMLSRYYAGVRRSGREVIAEPFLQARGGQQDWATTLILPVVAEEEFYGVVGVDVSLSFLHELGEEYCQNRSGEHRLEFVAAGGHVLAPPRRSGERNEAGPDAAALLRETGMDSNRFRDEEFVCTQAIRLSGNSPAWGVVARVPLDVITVTARQVVLRQITLSLLMMCGAVILLGMLAGGIARPVRVTTTMLKNIAEGEGDLRKRLRIASGDEIGQLAKWFNVFVSKVENLVRSVRESANEVAAGAAEIAASNQQVSGAILQVASQSTRASEDASDAGIFAEEGGKVVGETIAGIHAINEAVGLTSGTVGELSRRGQQIQEVLFLINTIAQQTNLLALNATIEAARAGDAGKGFAVVANEVKELARETSRATEDIQEKLVAIETETARAVAQMEAGARRAETGVKKAKLASTNLERIVLGTQRLTAMIQSITATTHQASDGVSQAASAASQLSLKAEELQDLVGRFKIEGVSG